MFTPSAPAREFDPEYPVGAAADADLRDALFAHWYPYILKIARIRICFAQAEDATLAYDADDLAQEIVLVALRRLQTYDPVHYSFRNWLSLAARATTFDIRRKCKRRAALAAVHRMPDDIDGGDGMAALPDRTAADPAAIAEARDLWRWGIGALEGAERRTLVLRFGAGLSFIEIGALDGVSRQVADDRARTGINRLRLMLS